MDTTIEQGSGIDKPKASIKETGFYFNEAVTDLRQGKRTESVKKLSEIATMIGKKDAKSMIDYLEKHEGLSPEFAAKMLSDAKIMKRVFRLTENFAKNGERMFSLEEAEIYCELFDNNDISGVLRGADLSEKFKDLRLVNEQGMRLERLNELRKFLMGDVGDKKFRDQIIEEIQEILNSLGVGSFNDPKTWEELTNNQDKFTQFCTDTRIQQIYSAVMDDRKLEGVGRSVELFWRGADLMPAMRVERFASNPETGSVSRVALEIEKEFEYDQNGEVMINTDGSKKTNRVIKNFILVIDDSIRGSNQGPEYLLSLLPLCKEYGVNEVEFVANMNIGSYVWTRISDIDALRSLQEMNPEKRAQLGHGPKAELEARRYLMAKAIIPEYERNMATAISTVLKSIDDPNRRKEVENILVHQFLEKDYEELKQKALAGEATMADLANLGQSLKIFNFDEFGKIVSSDDPSAKHVGHLGKAAIMGIPWKTRIKTDRDSLFAIIDKLHTGKGVVSAFQRFGMKIGAFIKAPKAKKI